MEADSKMMYLPIFFGTKTSLIDWLDIRILQLIISDSKTPSWGGT
jgi:hypothetical protein